MGRPPHPGTKPALFEFPFAEAEAARDRAEDLAYELRRLLTTHEDAWEDIAPGVFDGRTADEFRRRLGELLGAVDDHIAALRRQAQTIDDDLATARTRRDQNRDARSSWDRRYAAWRDWEPAGTPTSAPRVPGNVR